MRLTSRLLNLWHGLFRHHKRENDLAAELNAYLESLIELKINQGLAPTEARRQALVEVGGMEQVKERVREVGMSYHLETLLQDLRYGWRMLRRTPGFTIVAALTLALGIGANTIIFGLVYSVLLRPLPYPNADRLVVLIEADRKTVAPSNVDFATFADWQEQSRSFSSLAVMQNWRPAWQNGSEAEQVNGRKVSRDFWRTLGIVPVIGRDFLAEEDRQGQNHAVILSYGFWQRRFGGDPGVIGRTVRLDDAGYTIVGILPRDFRMLVFNTVDLDVWVPLGYDRNQPNACRGCQNLRCVGRLAPGTSVAQARQEMATIQARLTHDFPNAYDPDDETLVIPFEGEITGKVAPGLYLLFGAAGLVLLIACANLANLLLARGIQRSREFAVRTALGARRGRMLRQLLTESLLLGLLGGVGGLLLAWLGMSLLPALAPRDIPRLDEATISQAGLWFTGGLTMLTAIIFGLLPALQISRVDIQELLRGRGQGSTISAGIKNLLVIGELALTLVLLVGSALFLRSLGNLLQVNPGFEPHGVQTMRVSPSGERYKQPAAVVEFYKQVLDRTQKLPGVEAAGLVSKLPLSGDFATRSLVVEDRAQASPSEVPDADRYVISPGYLRAMRIPLLSGRDFTAQDNLNAPPVALVNEMTARTQWPGVNPIGKRINFGGANWLTVVGVVGDVRHYRLQEAPTLQVYQPEAQQGVTSMTIVARSGISAAALTTSIRQVVRSVDPGQPVFDINSLEAVAATSLAQQRFLLGLLGAFAAVALLLALVGVYGVMSYAVECRRHEFGVRAALGAEVGSIVRLALGQSLRLILFGLGLGLVASLGLSRLLTSLLFEVRPTDPAAVIISAALLFAAGLIASYIPARRAGRVDPLSALRSE